MSAGPLKVLVVGQTPPPFGGQALMIARMLAGSYRSARLFHVRMAFSQDMDEVGRFRAGKLLHLLAVIWQIWAARLRHGASVLYYPPAGPDRVPFYRDLAILIATRWMFRSTVFHFHAGGISELYPQLSPPLRLLFRMAYFRPNLAIRLSAQTPEDGKALRARRELIIPNGIEDTCPEGPPARPALAGRPARILFVGVLRESKGVLVLIEALRIIAERGVEVEAELVGKFVSAEFEQQVRAAVRAAGIEPQVHFPGVLTGEAKDRAFRSADIFCFPSFFESETFGVVLVEAMQYGLPIIATRWRGIPLVVREGVTGILVPIRDPRAVADRLAALIADEGLSRRLGATGRAEYLRQYTLDRFYERIDAALGGLVKEESYEASRLH